MRNLLLDFYVVRMMLKDYGVYSIHVYPLYFSIQGITRGFPKGVMTSFCHEQQRGWGAQEREY